MKLIGQAKFIAWALLMPIIAFSGYTEKHKSIDSINKAAWNQAETETIDAYGLALSAKSLSLNAEYNLGIAQSELTLGLISLNNGELEQALSHTLEALNNSSSDSLNAIIQNQIGRIYLELADFENASKHLSKAFSYNAKKNKNALVGNLINIGNLKENIFEIDSAFYYYNQGLELSKELKDTTNIITALNNLGSVNGLLNQISEEQQFYSEALQYADSSSIQFAQIAYNLAASYYATYDDITAEKYCWASLIASERTGFLKGQKSAYLLLSMISEAKGDYTTGLKFYKKYSEISEQIIGENTSKQLTKIQLSNDFAQQAKLDSIQKEEELKLIEIENNKKLAIEESKVQQRNIVIYASLAILGLLTFLAIKIFKTSKERKKQNEIIAEQKTEVEKQRDIAKHEHQVAEEQKAIVIEKNEEILESITYAKRLQTAILPTNEYVSEHLPNHFVSYLPKDIVAGDFYWVENVTFENQNNLNLTFFAVADCTGHGVPGAMVSVVCSNALHRAVNEFELSETGKILDKVTDIVISSFDKGHEEIKDGMDIILCAYNKETKELTYTGANNPLWIASKNNQLDTSCQYRSIVSEESDVYLHEIKANKQPVGKHDHREPFTTNLIILSEGDEVYMSTDGFPDQFGGEKGKKYKSANFKKFLLKLFNKDLPSSKDVLEKEFNDWTEGHEQIDDVCVMRVKF